MRDPEFRKVIESPSLPVTPAMSIAMLRTEDPTGVAYHLGKNPSEAARIARLAPILP
jgi:hypothetical protein